MIGCQFSGTSFVCLEDMPHFYDKTMCNYSPCAIVTGGHRTRVAAVTLDNMAERVSAQREDLP